MKWRGFPMEESEWLAEEDLQHAQDLLNDFKTRVVNRPNRGTRTRRKRGG